MATYYTINTKKSGEPQSTGIEVLEGFISYIGYLYSEGELSDQAYEALMSEVLSRFVERTMTLRVAPVLEEISEALQEVDEALLSSSAR